MKKLLFLAVFISSFSFAQVITDSILGNPKFVKEYVLFLNEVLLNYKFDKEKNWIECIKNVDGKDLYLWKREIQYYQ